MIFVLRPIDHHNELFFNQYFLLIKYLIFNFINNAKSVKFVFINSLLRYLEGFFLFLLTLLLILCF